MKILLDIDSTVNNLSYEWMCYLNEKYGLSVNYTDITTYSMRSAFPGLSEDDLYYPLNHQDKCLDVKLEPGAKYYIESLIKDRHIVKFVSARHKDMIKFQYDWMEKNLPFIDPNDIWIVHDKKWLKADILLDDCIDNLTSANYLGVAYHQPWNAHYPKEYTVSSWGDFYHKIRAFSDKFLDYNYPTEY